MSEERLGMVIDLAKCIGCNACAVACKIENDVPEGKFNTWVESWDVLSDDGRVRRANMPKQCNHCADAPCVSVCPTGASFRAEDGTVQVDPERCIGCKYCMAACPYSVRWCDDDTGEVHKCTYCEHRTRYGLEPACVSTCPTGARAFGNLNDPDSAVAKLLAANGGGQQYLAELGLDPAQHYLGLDVTEAAERVSNVHKGGKVYKTYEGR